MLCVCLREVMLVVNIRGRKGGSHAPGERPGPPAPPAFPSPAQLPTAEPEAGPDGAERPGYERRPHARFFAIYGLLVGTVTTCVALLFALVIDTEPELNGRPDATLPTAWPSGFPSDFSTELPSDFSTDWMTGVPSDLLTGFPTYPTDYPSGFPTDFPSIDPSFFSDLPTDEWTLPTDLFGESPEAP